MTDLAQQAAITHVSGPCLVIAGPGAGKTHVLVRRIAFLTESASIPPSQLLVITFTRAAAREMQKRYRSTVPPEYSGVTFGTFHSVFFNILKRSHQISSQALIDDKTQKYILNKAFKAAGVSNNRIEELTPAVCAGIGFVKNSDIGLEEYETAELSKEEFAAVYNGYEQGKNSLGLIDFDDMLLRTRELFLNNPAHLESYRNRFRYFLVDEAQDMNGIQYEILRMMAAGRDNIFLVGDEDQSIYSFRGAQPKLFLGFKEDYPNTKTIVLSKNYRCDIQIVESAKRVISHNKMRFDKNLCAAGDGLGKIRFIYCADPKDEAVKIAKMIRSEKQLYPEKSIAVLYRNHSRSDYISQALIEEGFCLNAKKLKCTWNEDALVGVVLDYIRLAVEGVKTELILKIMNVPNRYISREGLCGERVDFDNWKRYHCDDKDMISAIDSLKNDLDSIRRFNSFAAVSYVLYRMGCKKYALEKGKYSSEAVEKLMEMAKKHPDKSRLLEEIKNEAAEKKEEQAPKERVIYMYTYHGSKGLEFDHVYLIDVNEGITPSKRAVTEENIEEERRMFYVALTRAKHEITIASLTKIGKEEAYPSRFIQELGDDQSSGISSKSSSNVSDTSSASSSDSILSSTGEPSDVSK